MPTSPKDMYISAQSTFYLKNTIEEMEMLLITAFNQYQDNSDAEFNPNGGLLEALENKMQFTQTLKQLYEYSPRQKARAESELLNDIVNCINQNDKIKQPTSNTVYLDENLKNALSNNRIHIDEFLEKTNKCILSRWGVTAILRYQDIPNKEHASDPNATKRLIELFNDK